MFATLQLIVGDGNRRIRLDLLPGTLIDTVAHLGIELLPCGIRQMEGGCRLIVEQYLLCEFDTQCLLTVTQWQRETSVMSLSCGIRHISRHLKVIEHRMVGLRHLEGDGDVKLSIIACGGLSIEDLDAITAVIQ